MDDALWLGGDLSLPLDAVTETFAILAKRGSGKTYTAAVMVEEMIAAGLPVVVIDPVGVWWGLRSSANGTADGLPVVIFGGDHADLPLQEGTGGLIADALIEQRFPAVIDLSGFSKSAARRFMTDFAERLYQRNRTPLHLVLDEADSFAPQRAAAEGARLLGAIEDLVRRGRARGIGVTLITQRPAVLHKDVLTQAEVLIALRMTGPRDVAAIDEWVRLHAEDEDARTVKGSLPSLPVGTAWVWSPGWLGILQQVAVRERLTFDSSATPKAGQQRVVPERMAPVDLAALGERITALSEQAAEEDPARLRAEIAALRRKLRDRPSAEPVTVEVPVEVSVLTDEDRSLLREWSKQLADMGEQVAAILTRVGEAVPAQRPKPPARQASVPAKIEATPVRHETNGHPALPKAQRVLLAVLVQNARPLTAQQLAVLSGYSIKSSGFANALGALRSSGLAVGGRDAISATDVGRKAAGEVPPLPEGPALIEHWAGQLGKAERTLLRIVVDRWPQTMTAGELAEKSGYSIKSSGFANAIGRLRGLGLAHGGREAIAASDELGEAAATARP
jgi:uncharacterized protein